MIGSEPRSGVFFGFDRAGSPPPASQVAPMLSTAAILAPRARQRAVTAADGQRIKKRLYAIRNDDYAAIGLLEIAGDLGKKLIRCDPYRSHQLHVLKDVMLDLASDVGC